MADISLTASMRSNLLSLQQTQSLMDLTQERLSTGKKVNSAIDNPSSYYTAQSLTNRASDLSALLDSMGQAIQTIQAADEGIKTITEFAQQAKAVANQARDEAINAQKIGEIKGPAAMAKDKTFKVIVTAVDGTVTEKTATVANATSSADDSATALVSLINTAVGSTVAAVDADDATKVNITSAAGVKISIEDIDAGIEDTMAYTPTATENDLAKASRKDLAAQFDSILKQIDSVAKDSSYKGVNLLQNNDLKVIFNENRSSDLIVKGQDASSAGLRIAAATNEWSTDADVETAIKAVEDAVNTLRSMSSELGNNYSIVQSRETFTQNMINVLEEGADKLTLADMNEESANMLALQTRQQLAINSLSLASQAAQSVLKLF